ncbi:cupin domain-containing protein [Gayadomonas joobiniege]|uniref:cupin domain-containing protein n=1 Tax=Gayadomonas joobiniege TaxID=1234606 RepID=UPI00036578B0|nr:cupin domain-containing protein [Gayadomonas joobiniege]
MYKFNKFDIDAFLQDYWQKKPCLIRGMFADFNDPLSADELAGLAMENEVESRVVYRSKEQWQVTHGPLTDYQAFGGTDWTLLVQAVDHFVPEAAELTDCFRFIPDWRIDDLMVSFSTPGGGVGAHVDQYDVFIIQGQGSRHWKVGERQTLTQTLPHPDLLQVTGFEPCIDAVLAPGDVLYIPPGCPHEGYAQTPALNYSVGFRANNQTELLSAFADFALQESCFTERYTDPGLSKTQTPGQISTDKADQLIKLLQQTLSNKAATYQWLGQFLTQPKYEHELPTFEEAADSEYLVELIEQLDGWQRTLGVRFLFLHDSLFVHGEALSLSAQQYQFAQWLADNKQFTAAELKTYCQQPANLNLFSALVCEGFITPSEQIFDEDD